MRKTILVAGALILLQGCTSTPNQEPASNPSTPAVASMATQIEVATDGAINEDTDETVSAEPVPTWDKAAETAAITAGTAALAAFARPDLSQEQWWTQLRPHLTQEAAETYVYTDPINVPVSAVTGTATALESSSAYLALVDVETDVGTYQVLMVRADGEAPWLAQEFAPPPDQGP